MVEPMFGPGTHNAPFFPIEEGSLPRLEKENVCDWLGVGNNVYLCWYVPTCALSVNFLFLVSHLM